MPNIASSGLGRGSQERKHRDVGVLIKTAVQAEGAMYVPKAELFSNLLKLPEDTDLGQASCAMIAETEKCYPLYLPYSLQHHRDAIVKLALGGAQRNADSNPKCITG